jgi:hypothetical protein
VSTEVKSKRARYIGRGNLVKVTYAEPVSEMVLGPLGQPEKAMGYESRIELWSPNLTTFCFAGFGLTGFVAKKR